MFARLMRLLWAVLCGTFSAYQGELKAAVAARNAGDLESAARHEEQAYELARRVFGDRSIRTVYAKSFVAHTWAKLGKHKEAEALHKEALAEAQTLVSADSPRLLILLNGLALSLSGRDSFDEAEELFRRMLRIFEAHPNYRQVALGDCYTNLGTIARKRGHYDEAIQLHRRAMNAYKSERGEQSTAVAQALNNMAAALRSSGKLEEAADALEQALKIMKENHPPGHPQPALAMQNLGVVYRYLGRLEEAEANIKEALSLVETKLGAQHDWTALCLISLAFVQYQKGELNQAKQSAKRSLELRLQSRGDRHHSLTDNYHLLAKVATRQEDWQQADDLYEKARSLAQPSQLKELLDDYVDYLRLRGRNERADELSATAPLR